MIIITITIITPLTIIIAINIIIIITTIKMLVIVLFTHMNTRVYIRKMFVYISIRREGRRKKNSRYKAVLKIRKQTNNKKRTILVTEQRRQTNKQTNNSELFLWLNREAPKLFARPMQIPERQAVFTLNLAEKWRKT